MATVVAVVATATLAVSSYSEMRLGRLVFPLSTGVSTRDYYQALMSLLATLTEPRYGLRTSRIATQRRLYTKGTLGVSCFSQAETIQRLGLTQQKHVVCDKQTRRGMLAVPTTVLLYAINNYYCPYDYYCRSSTILPSCFLHSTSDYHTVVRHPTTS